MNVLVTGGAGYIGNYAVKELLKKGYTPIILDNLSTSTKENIDESAIFYEGDIRDKEILRKIFSENKIDVVMHFSAKLIVGESSEKPLEYYDNNVNGVMNLLSVMSEFGIKKIIFSSTASVYGMFNDGGRQVNEMDPANPINPYGETKLAAEKLIHWWSQKEKASYIVFRYFNVAGGVKKGADLTEMTHIIPNILCVAKGLKEEFKIFGDDYNTPDGTCIRDYIHVEDLATAHVLGAEKINVQEEFQNVYNLGNGNGFSVSEMIKEAEKKLNIKILNSVIERRIGDPEILVASSDKVIRDLLWEPKYINVGDMINDMWEKAFN